jgi:uncharacterized protein YggU (UPF0235/DUF167 family)
MRVRVVVTPGAKRETVTCVKESVYHVALREPAEQNLANKRVLVLMAREFGVPLAHVHMLTGHRSRGKMIRIEE